ncbi:hypothetical protein [uncultured Imperialibacter sp.]|uniref:COG4705 family protein n=1 Tax=uncultured Imperialibacter sp. TaxID=1672639 RepID=UPI0030DAA91D|tara:strand:- start:20032 stop:20841 length:810 start_codon:yes stop_codon:yes gene_type:complete
MEKLNKVAGITLLFWIMKILATTLGETLGDLLSMTLNIGYLMALLVTMGFFLIVLVIQLKADRYHAVRYWLVIVGTTTAGTEISDFMDRTLGLGYALGSSILFASLVLVLFAWHRGERTIEVYPIVSRKVEIYFWAVVLFSNSLGTAFGDFLSDNLGFSYLNGALVTAAIIVVVVMLHYFTRLNEVILFWIAFIFTRPFGATFGDLLTKPLAKGGLDLGTIPATVITTVLLGLLMVYSVWKDSGSVVRKTRSEYSSATNKSGTSRRNRK